mmetsp:Transcript_29861/g.91656  ORF Transcript_29861/g.91656 Transcript_29861/m.91656 type:complete len:92 (-) Transcript_29861:820-1095(-)|eukprot:scaffold292529_cov31-Tisochrysis_lutea.AAC.6
MESHQSTPRPTDAVILSTPSAGVARLYYAVEPLVMPIKSSAQPGMLEALTTPRCAPVLQNDGYSRALLNHSMGPEHRTVYQLHVCSMHYGL